MSDDEERPSDDVGPDIDLEKIASENAGADTHDESASDHGGPVDHGDHDHHDHGHEDPGRSTAPQSDFSTRQAAIGALVTGVGIAIAYLVPGLLG